MGGNSAELGLAGLLRQVCSGIFRASRLASVWHHMTRLTMLNKPQLPGSDDLHSSGNQHRHLR